MRLRLPHFLDFREREVVSILRLPSQLEDWTGAQSSVLDEYIQRLEDFRAPRETRETVLGRAKAALAEFEQVIEQASGSSVVWLQEMGVPKDKPLVAAWLESYERLSVAYERGRKILA